MTAPAYAELAGEYRRLWNSMKLDAGREASITAAARKVVAGRKRYEAVARSVGKIMPWEFIGITHLMEADCRFDCHPHNGDPLTARTRQVPAGRPVIGSPPFSWEESAVDCYGAVKRLGDVAAWPVERFMYEFERFNGFGYRRFHPEDLSPYLWARTNHNDGTGKYVSDGKYDRNAPSEGQCGAAAVLREVWRLTGKDSEGRQPVAAVPTDAADAKTTARITTGAMLAMAIGAFFHGIEWPFVVGVLVVSAVIVGSVYFFLRSKGFLK